MTRRLVIGQKGAQASQLGSISAQPSRTFSVTANSGTVQQSARNKPKLPAPRSFIIGQLFEGYTICALIRNPGPSAEYLVRDDKHIERIMRLEMAGRLKLRFASEILKRAPKAKETCGHDRLYMPEYLAYGVNAERKTNFLVMGGYGITLAEILSVLNKQMTPGCVLNIALQSLQAIRALHTCGFINRNIKPATFSVGLGTKEHLIMMADFRLCRSHFDSFTKQPREARANVAFVGTPRYSSVSALKELDQGRKDDIESWIYMIYDMYDMENGITWKKLAKEKALVEKEAFKKHAIETIYKNIPEEMKKLMDHVNTLEYASQPDYGLLKGVVEEVGRGRKMEMDIYDWKGMLTEQAVEKAVDDRVMKTGDLRCSGVDDFEGKKPPKKVPRKLMNPNDVIKSGKDSWKIVQLLGSGGFGDVYKVFNENGDPNKFYALKTESETGAKVMLRLKVEMQVLLAIQEHRKNPAKAGSVRITKPSPTVTPVSTMVAPIKAEMKHFVDFVDRGKSDELKCKFIVMSLVGPSLDECRKKLNIDLAKEPTPWIVAVQTCEAIRDLHTIGYLHRDIKPANFTVGLGANEHMVYLLDFGICRGFLDPKTKKMRAPRKKVKFLGTLRFASRACMATIDQGRKDDLESWIYMVYDIFDDENGIPWKRITNREDIYQAKRWFFEFKLTKSNQAVTKKMKQIVRYVDQLEYQSVPDYQYIINRLIRCATADNKTFDMKKPVWLGKCDQKKRATQDDSKSDSAKKTGSDDD